MIKCLERLRLIARLLCTKMSDTDTRPTTCSLRSVSHMPFFGLSADRASLPCNIARIPRYRLPIYVPGHSSPGLLAVAYEGASCSKEEVSAAAVACPFAYERKVPLNPRHRWVIRSYFTRRGKRGTSGDGRHLSLSGDQKKEEEDGSSSHFLLRAQADHFSERRSKDEEEEEEEDALCIHKGRKRKGKGKRDPTFSLIRFLHFQGRVQKRGQRTR